MVSSPPRLASSTDEKHFFTIRSSWEKKSCGDSCQEKRTFEIDFKPEYLLEPITWCPYRAFTLPFSIFINIAHRWSQRCKLLWFPSLSSVKFLYFGVLAKLSFESISFRMLILVAHLYPHIQKCNIRHHRDVVWKLRTARDLKWDTHPCSNRKWTAMGSDTIF